MLSDETNCSQSGFYLQSERKRSKECTFLRKGHYYISSNKDLFINYDSRQVGQNNAFWIIYETTDSKSNVRLKCGSLDSHQSRTIHVSNTFKYDYQSSLNQFLNLFSSKKPNVKIETTTIKTTQIQTNIPSSDFLKSDIEITTKFTNGHKLNEVKDLNGTKKITKAHFY